MLQRKRQERGRSFPGADLYRWNRYDFLLAVFFILLTAAMSFFIFQREKSSAARGEGRLVRVTIGGEVYGEYPLDQNQTVRIDVEHRINRIEIRDGEVWMEEANCADHYCVRQGKLHDGSRSIVCLPHRMVVEIIGGRDGEEPSAVDVAAG